jgi:hypothetical protein
MAAGSTQELGARHRLFRVSGPHLLCRPVIPRSGFDGWPEAVRRHVAGMNPKLRMQTYVRGGWFSRADALAAGYADSQIRVRLRSGQWRRLTRDAYVEPAAWPVDEIPWERSRRLHLLMIRAALGRLSPDVVVSHQSAAVLHGLPTWGLELSKVHVTRIEGRPRSDSLAAVHRTQIGMDEIVEVEGLRHHRCANSRRFVSSRSTHPAVG